MTAAGDAGRLVAEAEKHREGPQPIKRDKRDFTCCNSCGQAWPCLTARLAEKLERALVDREYAHQVADALRARADRLAEELDRLKPALLRWRDARRSAVVDAMSGNGSDYSPAAQDLQHLVTEILGESAALGLASKEGESDG